MKHYIQKTLKDTFLIWSFLGIGIIISAVFYAIMIAKGISENISLLVAFIILAGLVILGQAFSITSVSRLSQFLGKRLLGEQKPSKQLESLLVQQNMLLERLNQNLNSLVSNSVVGSTPKSVPEPPQIPKVATLQLSDESLSRLDNLVNSIGNGLLEQNQRKEQEIVAQFSNIIANQQESIVQVIQNLTAQQKSLEQLVQHLEEQDTIREESGGKASIWSPTGRIISRVDLPNVMHLQYPLQNSPLGKVVRNNSLVYVSVSPHESHIPNISQLVVNREALAAYDQAIRLDPNDASAYTNKGDTLNTLKRYEEALAAYDQAIRLDPNNAIANIKKGDTLNTLKRYEEALAAYKRAIRLDPNDAITNLKIQALTKSKESGTEPTRTSLNDV